MTIISSLVNKENVALVPDAGLGHAAGVARTHVRGLRSWNSFLTVR